MIGLWVASLALLAVALPAGWGASDLLFGGTDQGPIIAYAFAGIGWRTTGDALLAQTSAALARERRRIAREELISQERRHIS